MINGDHVTLQMPGYRSCDIQPPGHGEDDLLVSRKYELPVISPIDDKGVFTTEEAYGQFERNVL